MKKTSRTALTAAVITAAAMMLSGCVNVNVNVDDQKNDDAAVETTEVTEEVPEAGSTDATETEETSEENTIFDITLPEELDGTYIIVSTKNSYSVCEKEAYEAGFGGFAFSISAYEKPSDYAGGIDMKVGEIVKGDEVLYDIVRGYPSDIQFDYEKYEDTPESYTALCDCADDVFKSIKVKGDGEFVWESGCKGEDLYKDVLAKYVTAIEEKWDSNKLEQEEMSPQYNEINVSGDAMNTVGFAYRDVNIDGIDELLIGEIADGDYKGTVYDIYTMVDRKPAHVVSGSARDRYYPLDYGMIVNEASSGADDSEWQSYDIEPNTTNLLPQLGVKMDGYENKDKPWFVNYGSVDEWENITEEEFEDYKSRFEYVRLDFTPLASFK